MKSYRTNGMATGNEKTLRQIFEVLIRIERLLKKNEIKEEPKKQVLKGNE